MQRISIRGDANCLIVTSEQRDEGLDESIHEVARAGLKVFIEQSETEEIEDDQIACDGLIRPLNDKSSNKKFLTIDDLRWHRIDTRNTIIAPKRIAPKGVNKVCTSP